MKCPCTINCKNRTATCKADGTCPNGFAEYDRERMDRYKQQDSKRELAFRAKPKMYLGRYGLKVKEW